MAGKAKASRDWCISCGVVWVEDDREPYPSAAIDAQKASIGPFLDAWWARRVSVARRLGEQDPREVVNAILYQNWAGSQRAHRRHHLVARLGSADAAPSTGDLVVRSTLVIVVRRN